MNFLTADNKRIWELGAEIVGTKRFVLLQDKYKSFDGTDGLTASRSFTTNGGTQSHTVTIKNGLITAWDVV